jgi:hypothetical protein
VGNQNFNGLGQPKPQGRPWSSKRIFDFLCFFFFFFFILNSISSVFNLFEFYEALWISLVLAISWYCELRKRVMYETDFDVMNGLLES